MKISPGHASLAGHFPGNPIVPGVVLLDEVTYALAHHLGADVRILGMPTLKFLTPLLPGEDFHINVVANKSGRASFEIVAGARKILTGSATYEDIKEQISLPADTGA